MSDRTHGTSLGSHPAMHAQTSSMRWCLTRCCLSHVLFSFLLALPSCSAGGAGHCEEGRSCGVGIRQPINTCGHPGLWGAEVIELTHSKPDIVGCISVRATTGACTAGRCGKARTETSIVLEMAGIWQFWCSALRDGRD